MSRLAIFFLVVFTLGLALLLALLGFATFQTNLLGWFLLLVGLIYFFGVVIVYWIRGIQFWHSRAKGQTLKEERDEGSFWFIVLGMVAAFYLPPLEYLFVHAIFPRTFLFQVLGLFFIFLGSALFIWARRILGKFYSGHLSILNGQRLIQNGPYRFVRHPAYAGYILIALGLAFGYSSLAGFAAILIVLLPSMLYRIRVEDKLLAEHFGAQFDEYARKTKRLFPLLW
jgi:protein-S-isoprenylcysteine O-methyltransferase Ste14